MMGIIKGKISVAIPRTSGGGAETFTRQLINYLDERDELSRVYVGNRAENNEKSIISLGRESAAGSARRFSTECYNDPASCFLLVLGYANLAPIVKLRKPDARVVIRICNPPTEEMKDLSIIRRLRYWASMKVACASADTIIAQCEYMKQSLIEEGLASTRKVKVCYNPVDRRAWLKRGSTSPLHFPYILCAATNKPQKDLSSLIRAYARVQALTTRHLVIAGVDPRDELVTRIVAESGAEVDRVHCLGFVSDIFPLIENSDLCVLSSRFEGFSNFLLEAAAFGKTIIATDCPGGNSELFIRYPNHFSVPVADIEILGAALLRPRSDLVKEQSMEFLKDFDFHRIMADYCNILNDAS
jgi:glycosyltransferase involved in cell wall biosynthesis